MKGTTDDFKRKYREMSDDGLLAIDRGELVEAARQCYDEELAGRSLVSPQTEPAARSEAVDKLVPVGIFVSAGDANLAQSVLESADIPCFQPDRRTLDVDPWLQIPLGGRRLLVPASRAEQARELLGPMTAEANKAIVRHWFEEVWNAGHEDAAREFGAGADARLRSLLPDLRVTVDDMIAEGDKVAARIAIQGTHHHAPVQFHGVVFVRLEDGRIVDTWDMNDAPASLSA
jgi:SnoaL-like polyketide cyclase